VLWLFSLQVVLRNLPGNKKNTQNLCACALAQQLLISYYSYYSNYFTEKLNFSHPPRKILINLWRWGWETSVFGGGSLKLLNLLLVFKSRLACLIKPASSCWHMLGVWLYAVCRIAYLYFYTANIEEFHQSEFLMKTTAIKTFLFY